MRVLVRKSDNHLLQAQSGDHAALEPLLAFAESRGYSRAEVEARVVSGAEFAALLVAQTEAEKTYAQRRAADYPPVGDQLDDLFKAGAFSAEMQERIAAVKARHPKP